MQNDDQRYKSSVFSQPGRLLVYINERRKAMLKFFTLLGPVKK